MMEYHEHGQNKTKQNKKLTCMWLIMGNKAVSYKESKLIVEPY